MARLWSCGFELNSATSGVEVNSVSGSPTISTTTVRSGVYSARINSLASGARKAFDQQFLSAVNNGPFWGRAYYHFVTFPSAETTIMSWSDATVTYAWVSIDNTGTLRLRDEDGEIENLGAVGTGAWIGIQMKFSRGTGVGDSQVLLRFLHSASGDLKAIGATPSPERGSTARSIGGTGVFSFNVGGNLRTEAVTGGDWYIDDVAVNDSTAGGDQTSWPNDGQIVHCFPDADGDTGNQGVQGTDWQTAPTAGQTSIAQVDEAPPPDDATSYLQLITESTGATDPPVHDYNVQGASARGIPSNGRITLVAVAQRFNDAGAGNEVQILRIKSQSGGTVVESAAQTVNTTIWVSFHSSQPKTYKLLSYTDPQNGGRPWTPALIDTMQIGIRASDAAPDVWISLMWALVEYTVAAPLPPPFRRPRVNASLRM